MRHEVDMTITLNTFRAGIPASILARGRDLYDRGRVLDLSFTDEDAWNARVQGSTRYDIEIFLEPDSSLICSCTCPYDYGEYCKHIAAVLYAIEGLFPEHLSKKKRKTPAKKRQTKADKLRQVVEAAPHEVLVSVLMDLTAEYRQLINVLLLKLGATGEKSDYAVGASRPSVNGSGRATCDAR